MPAKNNLPGVLGQLDLEKLNHDGQYYGAFEELTKLLDGSHPDILNGVNLGRAASYRQYVKGDKMTYGIANAIAGGIDRANYDKIKRAVLGDSVVDAAKQQRLQKEQKMQEKADRERRELQERRRIESEAQKKAMADALHKYRDLTPDDLPKILRRIRPDRIGRHDTLAGLQATLSTHLRKMLESKNPPDTWDIYSEEYDVHTGIARNDADTIAKIYVEHMAAMVMGEPRRLQEEEAQRQKVELAKTPISPAKADLPALDTQIDWESERKKIAPKSLADIKPDQIRNMERMPLKYGEGDYVDWKYQITDKLGRTATITGNAKIPHDAPDHATILNAMQTAPDGWNAINYRPDLDDYGIREQAIQKIEKKAYTVYRAWFLARNVDTRRKAVKRMLDMKLPREAVEHIKKKYVIGHFNDSRDEWISRIKQYDG